MNYQEWATLIPSALSAVAAFAAAYAALKSLTISRESKEISEKNAIAIHHGGAAHTLTEVQITLARELKDLSELAYCAVVNWASEIGKQDSPDAAGSDPRPLRHVLSNGAEILVWHASQNGKDYVHAGNRMYSIVRDGLGEISEKEFQELMQEGDGCYTGFELHFGIPSANLPIENSRAFKWVYYQLMNRVSLTHWEKIWQKARQPESWLARFCAEYQKLIPTLSGHLEKLKKEAFKLNNTIFPLNKNPLLKNQYGRTIDFLESVLANEHHAHLSEYEGAYDSDDFARLVLFLMGLAQLTSKSIDHFHYSLEAIEGPEGTF